MLWHQRSTVAPLNECRIAEAAHVHRPLDLMATLLFVLCATMGLVDGLRATAFSNRPLRGSPRSAPVVLDASATLDSAAASKQALVATCQSAPPNGIGASDEEVAAVEAAIQELEPFCQKAPAQVPLTGAYDLLARPRAVRTARWVRSSARSRRRSWTS